MLTKQDYEAIADTIKSVRALPDWGGPEVIAAKITANAIIHHLADYFQRIDPDFDRKNFLVACVDAEPIRIVGKSNWMR